jgi:hypothetical protein
VHEVAFVELQVNAAACPLTTLVGDALKLTVGTGRMLTVALAGLLLPPGPVHVNKYVVVLVSAPVLKVPLAATLPRQPPDPPVAAHVVAFVEFQVKIEELPLAIAVGAAVRVTVGAEDAVTVTVAWTGALVPPGPEQTRE